MELNKKSIETDKEILLNLSKDNQSLNHFIEQLTEESINTFLEYFNGNILSGSTSDILWIDINSHSSGYGNNYFMSDIRSLSNMELTRFPGFCGKAVLNKINSSKMIINKVLEFLCRYELYTSVYMHLVPESSLIQYIKKLGYSYKENRIYNPRSTNHIIELEIFLNTNKSSFNDLMYDSYYQYDSMLFIGDQTLRVSDINRNSLRDLHKAYKGAKAYKSNKKIYKLKNKLELPF